MKTIFDRMEIHLEEGLLYVSAYFFLNRLISAWLIYTFRFVTEKNLPEK